eukprot:4602228-Alexandrium_andersonii.AAC.1
MPPRPPWVASWLRRALRCCVTPPRRAGHSGPPLRQRGRWATCCRSSTWAARRPRARVLSARARRGRRTPAPGWSRRSSGASAMLALSRPPPSHRPQWPDGWGQASRLTPPSPACRA